MQIRVIEVVLKDTLFNCSKQCTSSERCSMTYAKGILVGVVSTVMASGMPFEEACELIQKFLPADFDHSCVPESWQRNFPVQSN